VRAYPSSVPQGTPTHGQKVRCVRGGEWMEARRLKPESPTRRMVATCCNSVMFLDFTKGHWLTLYRDRLPALPPLEMRVMTADRREGVVLPEDVPNYATHSGKFMWKLLAGSLWVFGRPRWKACRPKGTLTQSGRVTLAPLCKLDYQFC
jgi:hypothetical protein